MRDNLEITDTLAESGDKVPADLIGATILRFGCSIGLHMEEGGLIVEYKPRGSDGVKQLILAFNDCAMWIIPEHKLDSIQGAAKQVPALG